MKLKGLKKAVGEIKRANFARVYLNTATGDVIVMTYLDAEGCSFVGNTVIRHVERYTRACVTMAQLRNDIEEWAHFNGIEIE